MVIAIIAEKGINNPEGFRDYFRNQRNTVYNGYSDILDIVILLSLSIFPIYIYAIQNLLDIVI